MSIIESNEILGTVTEVIAGRIVIDWNPYTNDGNVTFYCDKMVSKVRQGEPPLVLERGYFGTMSARISDIVAGSYDVGGVEVPGALLMGAIKAAFDATYIRETTPLPTPIEPDNVDGESSGAPANP